MRLPTALPSLMLLFVGCASAQQTVAPGPPPTTDREAVRQQVERLFGFCSAGDHESAATVIAYRGRDSVRRWKDLMNFESAEERDEVAQACAAIRRVLAGVDSREWGEYAEEEESEGVWHVQSVVFSRGADRNEVFFAFLRIGGTFALGDID